jgi:heavy metal sensor kinase
MTLTLRARLAVVSALVFGVLLAAVSVVSYQVFAQRLDADVSTRLTEITTGLHGYLQFHGELPTVEFDANDDDEAAFVHEATQYYQIYDADSGHLLVESDGLAPLGLHLTPAEVQAYRAEPKRFDISTSYGRIRVSNSELPGDDKRTYLLQVGISLAPMDATLARYRDLLWWRVGLALIAGVVAAWWLSGFALSPLSKFADEAGAIDVASLGRRLPVHGSGDEIDRVAAAFNQTLTRLERAVGEMRQFSGALAHELRTPLAVLRGEAELALRNSTNETEQRALVSQIEEFDKLKHLIEQSLTLARAESGQFQLSFVGVDLGTLATRLVTDLEPVAHARGISLVHETRDPVWVNGDPEWLERLLLNLLDNALKFTGDGGRIRLLVSRDGPMARVSVQDSGVGMTADVLPHVFERFYQADSARSTGARGAGLGLSLVKWIVETHRGTVSVASEPGIGSTFTVTLLAADAVSAAGLVGTA